DNLLLYAVTRRAYKSGGYNGSVSNPGGAAVAGDEYLTESVSDVEVGAKYQAGRTRIAVALFNNWLRNSQRTAYTAVNGGPAAVTVNIPKGKVYGAEIEVAVKAAYWLSLGTTFNYTKGSYSGVAAGATALAGCNGASVFVNASVLCFDQLPDIARTSGTVFADIDVPVSGNINLSLHGDVYHTAKATTSPRSVNSFGTTIPGYATANFRIGFADKQAGWSLIGNLKNAFNKVYYAGGVNAGEIYQINTLVPGEPRTWTVEARFKF
ncbi:MAG: hypothetical protein RL367_1068, partial [Pseudomonadota bacterium]